jgi:hypothetical protein
MALTAMRVRTGSEGKRETQLNSSNARDEFVMTDEVELCHGLVPLLQERDVNHWNVKTPSGVYLRR